MESGLVRTVDTTTTVGSFSLGRTYADERDPAQDMAIPGTVEFTVRRERS